MVTRAKAGITKLIQKLCLTTTKYPLLDEDFMEPTCYSKACKIPESRDAIMDTQINALIRNRTYSLVKYIDGMNVVGSKWVYRIKRNPHGTLQRRKARLVLSLAVMNNWQLRQLDVENAFLHGVLEEEVYINSLPAMWIRTTLIMYASCINPIWTQAGTACMLVIDLGAAFVVKDMSALSYFLGVEVLKQGNNLVLSQRKYISYFLHRTTLDRIKPVCTPLEANTKLQRQGTENFLDPTLYGSVVGALQYLHITIPDIVVAVNKACQYMHEPYLEHWVKRILRFLKQTIDYGLFFKPDKDYSLNAYSDADWEGSLDDRRSTSGYCIYFGDNLISWSAKEQKTVLKSSTESEYRGIAIATSELIWIQSLLK
ncbi:uncharacterized protein LOC113352862 [Papaver somniferum]|uniref:uncharacterized protein LOC113352862 n=1 Tax=Papaver somniferum TaxID=3469 RepID=UPI000E6FCA67|nr:uncharacterized protein LOC113352862 [Papaver somniferum]